MRDQIPILAQNAGYCECSCLILDDTFEHQKFSNGIRHRPRKRARLTPPDSGDENCMRERNRNAVDLWWSAAQSDALLPNGLPCLVQYPSSNSNCPPPQVKPESNSLRPPKRKRVKRKPQVPTAPPNTLLGIMSSNVRTLKRVRRTHAKFAALNLNTDDGGGALGLDEPPESAEDDPVDEFVDERPWKVLAGFKGEMESGVELGGARAMHCLRWMNGKVLEHAGFQGACLLAASRLEHRVPGL